MKKQDSFSMQNAHLILLSEELRRAWNSIERAESFLEFEMAMRDLERIVKRLENQSGA